jgi:hypothetical protein
MQASANKDQISQRTRNRSDDDALIRASRNNNGPTYNSIRVVDVPTTTEPVFIDNKQTMYKKIRLDCGITVMCHPDICSQQQQQPLFHQIRTILQTDVSYCLQTLPLSVRSLIRRTNIWVNLQNYYYHDPQTKHPIYVNHTTTHHHVAWLLW